MEPVGRKCSKRAAKVQLEAQVVAARVKEHAGKHSPRGHERRCTPKETICLLSALGTHRQPETPGPFVALESTMHVLRGPRFSKQDRGPKASRGRLRLIAGLQMLSEQLFSMSVVLTSKGSDL